MEDAFGTASIENCYNTGEVNGNLRYVAGIVGLCSNSGNSVKNVFNTGTIKKGATQPTANVGAKSNSFVGYLVGRYGKLEGLYSNTSNEDMATWTEDDIKDNIGAEFKKDIEDSNGKFKNEGLPILSWQ